MIKYLNIEIKLKYNSDFSMVLNSRRFWMCGRRTKKEKIKNMIFIYLYMHLVSTNKYKVGAYRLDFLRVTR